MLELKNAVADSAPAGLASVAFRRLGAWAGGLALAALCCLALAARAESARPVATVSIPNGYLNVAADDLQVQTSQGLVQWKRSWDGNEWKFNPQWESLSQSWKNLTGSATADTSGGTISSGGAGGSTGGGSSSASGGSAEGCWVWVDEDWTPTVGTTLVGGIPDNGPLLAERATPFNRIMGDGVSLDYPPPQRVNIDWAALCYSGFTSGGVVDTEGIRRINEMYLGEGGRYAFNNRSVLDKRAVRQLPAADAASLYASLGTGRISLAPVTNAKGFRWMERGGAWIDYNTQGQIVAFGDKNDNTVWLVRDSGGRILGAVEGSGSNAGRVLYSLHYSGALITEVRDYPIAGLAADLPARSVRYQYDDHNRLSRVTDARGNLTQFDYDPSNRLLKITDAEGRAEQFAYNGYLVKQRTAADGAVTDYAFDYDDSNKQFISKITGPDSAAGRRVEDYTHNRVSKLVRRIVAGRTDEEVRYDSGARAEIHTNARGFTTRIVKNEFEQIVETDLADGAVRKSVYSALNLALTEETDELGIKTQYQVDAKGNLLKKTEAAGTAAQRVTDYLNDGQGRPIQVIRRGRTEATGTVTPDASWQLDYDGQGQLRQLTDPEGNASQVVFDRAGNLVSITDPRGNTTRFATDAHGNVTQITDALGRSRTIAYDKVGNPIALTDPRAKVIQAAYDAMNRRSQTTNAVGGQRKTQYNGQGLPIADSDEDGRTRTFDFDVFLRLTRQSDAMGNATQYAYNVADVLGSLTGPTETTFPSYTQQTRYDSRERPTLATQIVPGRSGNDTRTSSVAYDLKSQIKSDTDANGKSRVHVYDALGQRTESTDSLGNKARAVYDARGNLIQLSDALGHSYGFDYDRRDLVIKETLPLGQITRYRYDAAGNLVERSDPDGHKLAYAYDAANRLVEVKHSQADASLVRTTTFTWDPADNLTAWSDTDNSRSQTSASAMVYDDANRKTSETVTYPTGDTFSYAYTYSPASKKTQLAWPDGTAIGYAYSGHGELQFVTIPGEGSVSVTAFKWTAPASVLLPGGVSQERSVDGLLNLEGLDAKTPTAQPILSLANAYGKVEELKSSDRTDTINATSSTRSSRYAYDDEVRLTQATVNSTPEIFTLDGVGNRTAHSQIPGAWTYDANNRLLQRGTASTYQYDDAGNQIQRTDAGGRITKFAYDTLNRLIEVRDGTNSLIARYGYDPLSRRLWKEQYRDATGAPLSQSRRILYLYADEGLIAEATQPITLNADGSVTATGATAITRQYGPRPDAPFTTGVLFVKTANSNGENVFAYYHHDHLNTPMMATDKTGSIVWAASYNAFGMATITTPTATADKPTIESNLRLPGQYADGETGLHGNWFRYYDPWTGTYLQADPLGLRGGINLYLYVRGNPLTYTDPMGLDPGNGRGFSTYYGNWCGKNWSGGKSGPIIPSSPEGAVDSLDSCCMAHDYCYAKIEDKMCPLSEDEKKRALDECDATLAKCSRALSNNGVGWPLPPKSSTDAYFYKQKLQTYYK